MIRLGGMALVLGVLIVRLILFLNQESVVLPEHSIAFDWPFSVQETASGQRMVLQLNGQKIMVNTQSQTVFQYGDRVYATIQLQPCHSYRNPGVFNYCDWLNKKGIVAMYRIQSMERLAVSKKPLVLIWLSTLPNRIFDHLTQLSPTHAPIIYTMLFGSRQDFLGTDVKQTVQGLGLIHLLVVSGAQMSIITGCLWGLFRIMLIPPSIRLVIIGVCQMVYLSIVGLDASICRAVVMTDMLLIHRFILLKRYPIWWYLMSAALVIAFFIPESILFAGFWYSFFITLSLMVVCKLVVPHIHGPTWFVSYIVASLVATLAAFPIQILSNSWVDLVSIVSNIWVSWMGTIILMVGLMGYFLWLWMPFFGDHLYGFVNALCDVFMSTLSLLDALHWIVAFNWMERLGVLIAIGCLVLTWLFRHPWRYGLMAALFVLVVGHIIPLPPQLLAIDVGQGDATLIVSNGRSVLIDTGGVEWTGEAIAKKTIVPVLYSLGIRALDYVIITHHDLDHYGGIYDLQASIPIDCVVVHKKLPDVHHQLTVSSTMSIQFKSTHIDILNPAHYSVALTKNNQSLITTISLNGWRFLMTGDADQSIEHSFIRHNRLDRVDVLKLGHHGSSSSTSPELLHATHPKFIWNSAGLNNWYGHPHAATLDRIKKRSIPMLSTHTDGAIRFYPRKNKLRVVAKNHIVDIF